MSRTESDHPVRVLFARDLPPEPKGMDGGGVASLWVIDQLIAYNHSVDVLYIEREPLKAERKRLREELIARGVTGVYPIEVPAFLDPKKGSVPNIKRYASIILNKFRRQLAENSIQRQVSDVVINTSPNVYFGFGEILMRSYKVKNVPKVGWLWHTGEPFREIKIALGLEKILGSSRLAKWYYPLWLRKNHKMMAKIVASLDTGICMSHWYGDRYREICSHLPRSFIVRSHPADDESADILAADPNTPPPNASPYRVVMVGNLQQTFTSSGLNYLAEEILPVLESRGIIDRFEFLIVGKFSPRPEIARKLSRFNVIHYAGYVENLAEVVNRAHVVLHPVPYAPGAGVRLSTMFGMHACCLVHAAVGNSFPELSHGLNCMIAQTGEEFADALVQLATNSDLAGCIRKNARATFDRYYRWKDFAPELSQIIIEAARDHSTPDTK